MNRKICALYVALFCVQNVSTNNQFAGLPAYQQLLSEQADLAQQVTIICSLFDRPVLVPTTVASGMPIGAVQRTATTVTNFYDAQGNRYTYEQILAQMTTILGASGGAGTTALSYKVLFAQVWDFYDELGTLATPSAPFEQDSLALQMYTGLVSDAITYIKKRLATITEKTYGQTNAAQLLKGDIAAFDQIIDAVADEFKKHVGSINVALVPHYLTVQKNYRQRKAQLLLAWLEPLLMNLTTTYATTLAQGVLTTDLNIQNIDAYTQLFLNSLSAFSTTQTITMLGKYNSVFDVVTAFSAQMAKLFLYQAFVFQNAIEHNIQVWGAPGQVLSQSQFVILAGQIQSCSSLFGSAASYYVAAQQAGIGQTYAQQSAALQGGLQSWQNGIKTQQQGYMGQVAQQLDQASTQFKSAGNTYLSFYLYQQFQQALLAYDQSIIATYGNYYQSAVAAYIQQAQKVPTGQSLADMAAYHQQFQSLFYPLTSQDAQNAAYKGMAWLAQLALPSFKDILSSLQTVASAANADQQEFLQQGIDILQNISEGSQYIFYSSPQVFGDSTAPADQNGSSYTVTGLVQACEQYALIVQLFSQADAVFEKNNSNSTLVMPFAQVLPQSPPVSSWKQLIMLHQAYWFLVCAEQARAYVTTCVPIGSQVEEFIVASLIAFWHAQGLYASAGMTDMVAYIQAQIQSIVGEKNSVKYGGKTVEELLLHKASTFTVPTLKNSTRLDTQSALTCYQIGGLLGFASCRTKFFDTLDQATLQVVSQQQSNLFQGFSLAALALQGLYAQQAGWQTTHKYASDFSYATALLKKNLLSVITQSGSIQDKITVQKQFVAFYKQYQGFVIEQERLAALYGLSIEPYLNFKNISGSLLSFTVSTQNDPLMQCNNPSYTLAQLYVSSAQAQLAAVQKAIFDTTFTDSLTDAISVIETTYNQAIAYYSAAGLQEMVLETEKLKSKAMGLLYFGMVVPWKSQGPIQQKNVPAYLLRSVAIDITSLAQSFVANTSVAQAVTQSSSLKLAGTPNSDFSTEIVAAQQLLQDAAVFVGKSTANPAYRADIVTKILLPLYRLQLQQEGYTGFLTRDQKVQQYQQQIEFLMSTGMLVGTTALKAVYSVMQQKHADGTQHFIVQGTNVPLAALVEYQGQKQSALLYYTLCSKFYNTSQSTTSIGDVTYVTVADADMQAKINNALQQAYIAGTTTYVDETNDYIASLKLHGTKIALSKATLAQKALLDFAEYQSEYTTMSNMFVWALSLITAQANQQSSTANFDVNVKKALIYQNFAQACSYFLMGNPASGPFQSVLKDVANNYYAAGQSNLNSVLESSTAMALLYEQVADYAITLPLALTQINGYPRATATPITGSQDAHDPVSLGTVKQLNQVFAKSSVAPCSTVPTTVLYPSTQPLAWYNYQQAAGLYQQAYTVMQQGLIGMNPFTASIFSGSADLVRMYGKFFYYDFFSAMQMFSLFARNAYVVGFNKKLSTGTVGVLTGGIAPDFLTIVQQGGSAGATTAAQGFSNLADGTSQATSVNVAQQYTTMKSLLLNSMLYLTGVQGALNQLIQTLGVTKAFPEKGTLNNALNNKYGQLLQCAFTTYIPGLQTLIGGQNINTAGTTSKAVGTIDTLKPIIEIPSYLFDLQTSLNPIFQVRVVHADTFLTAMQYVVENSIGNPENNFSRLGDAKNSYVNLLVFNKLVSELWSIMRDLYGQSFLADLYEKRGDAGGLSAYLTAINAAIQGQQQQQLINPASYIG